MAVSVFDLFKIGIGPSSSHTVGPMRAARLFASRLEHDGLLPRTARVLSQLYGSLGATGKGHGSDKAVLLGLAGHEPDTVDADAVPQLLQAMREAQALLLLGRHRINFNEREDLKFYRRESLPCLRDPVGRGATGNRLRHELAAPCRQENDALPVRRPRGKALASGSREAHWG